MRKVLVLGVATIALIAFSGLAVGDIWCSYYVEYNTKGWLDHGTIGNYHIFGKYNYREKQVYSLDHGWIYTSYYYVHSNFDLKCLDGNKPIMITHYNGLYRYKAEMVDPDGTLKWSDQAVGFFRCIDPRASDLGYYPDGTQACWYYSGLKPVITKFMDHRPAAEDSVELIEMIFDNIDYTLIPLIKYIEFRDINGNSIQIDVDMS